ncbi:MAG: protein kinase domain-containing protein, partial [Gemmatimonadaceae bacterium]
MTSELDRLRTALEDRYAVEREIGRGGMASVYLAQDLKHGRPVAIKVLSEEVGAAIGADRFLREIQVAARLNDPHIVPLYDSGNADGLLYYVMPYVEGETLAARLQRERQLSFGDVLSITRDVAQGLAYAHAQGVLHRDIKPANILLSRDSAVVADFGIARALTTAAGERLTSGGIVLGTPDYMSPEQAFGQSHLTERSDVYSLGCVVYEMLAGTPPFTGVSQPAIIARHAADPVPSLRTVRATLPAAVERVVVRALAKAPNDRYATTTELLQALTEALQPASSGATLVQAPPARRRLTPIIAGAIALLLIVAAAILLTRQSGDKGGSAARVPPMLAVLLFENLGPPDDTYFADGMTDEITTRLSHISGLGVISRNSALQFNARTTPIREIARQLGAQWILVGTIRTDRRSDGSGNVRVTPRLFRASNDRVPAWEES